jgi:hypothetical protein
MTRPFPVQPDFISAFVGPMFPIAQLAQRRIDFNIGGPELSDTRLVAK